MAALYKHIINCNKNSKSLSSLARKSSIVCSSLGLDLIGMYVSLYECFNLLLYIFPTFSIVESNESSTVVIYECFVAHPAIGNDVESWLVDTGVITHVIAQDKLMSKIENVIVKVFVGNGTKIPCIKQGELRPTDEKGVLLYQDRKSVV